MSDFNESAQKVKGKLPIHIMSFSGSEDGETVCDDHGIGELTDFTNGFAEIGMTYGDERVYVRFRLSDLIRATKEFPL